MKKLAYVKTIALFMAVLIMSLPFVFAEEYSLLYDANGNLVYDQETNVYREYNELNQLIRTRINNASGTILQEYTWDPIEERIFIKDEFYNNGSLKSSTYYFGDDYIVIQNSSGTYNRTNIYQDGVLVGYEDFDGRKRYVLPDHEGSVHLILNESGDVIEENLFSPFAEPLQGVIENKFSYEAKEYDSLVKDYDFHFRKYDPKLRIFTQPDTLIQNVYDPQNLNRYAFERSSPYKYSDPDGHTYVHYIIAKALEYIFTRAIPNTIQAIAENIGIYSSKYQDETKENEIEKQWLEEVPNTIEGVLEISDSIANEANLGNEEQTQGTQINVEVQTPENTNPCEFNKLSNCEQEIKTEDSKLKGDLIEDEEPKMPKPEEKKEEPKGTGGGPGGSGGGVIIPCNLNCPYILWPNPYA